MANNYIVTNLAGWVQLNNYHIHNEYIITLVMLVTLAIFSVLHTRKKHKRDIEKFKSYYNNSPFGIFITNNRGENIEVNNLICEITGYKKEELINKTLLDITPPKNHQILKETFKKVKKNGKAYATISIINNKKEKCYWSIDSVKISKTLIIGFVTDITEQIKIKKRVELLGMVVDQSVNEVFIIDYSTFTIIECNKTAKENNPSLHQNIQSQNFTQLIPQLSLKKFIEIVQPLKTKKQSLIKIEQKKLNKTGFPYYAEINIQNLIHEHKNLLFIVIKDISKGKRAELELENLKNRLELEVKNKTRELEKHINELEHFRDVTVERELRMKELRDEIERLKQHG
ncbi:PAS domain S-box protein [Marinilabiliaceae bacterium ANBcel2]|nr:PAS domain S-box protein [Marinilabiliaceae bacterium ANBcel2]